MWFLLVDSAANNGEVQVQFGPEALLGPFALLVAALIAVGVLWREDRRVYRERVADLREARDKALAGWQAQTDANETLVEVNKKGADAIESLAKAWREKNRVDGARRRIGDRERAE